MRARPSLPTQSKSKCFTRTLMFLFVTSLFHTSYLLNGIKLRWHNGAYFSHEIPHELTRQFMPLPSLTCVMTFSVYLVCCLSSSGCVSCSQDLHSRCLKGLFRGLLVHLPTIGISLAYALLTQSKVTSKDLASLFPFSKGFMPLNGLTDVTSV